MKRTVYLLLACTLSFQLPGYAETVEFDLERWHFEWQLDQDAAKIAGTGGVIWQGSLFPSFWLTDPAGKEQFVHGGFLERQGSLILFGLADLGRGRLSVSCIDGMVRFEKLEVEWNEPGIRIISMNFGLVELTPETSKVVPSLEDGCWPDWRAEGYCVPTAKGAPIQSFFRFWQFGSASIPLGNFGSSLGTPYAAAYPRPLYACAMGGRNGWVCFGAGTIPDGAMVLKLRTASSYLHYLYREDLWGAPEGRKRSWDLPLIICPFGNAWGAYEKLFASLGQSAPVDPVHQLNHWNSWGDFRQHRFDMKQIMQRAMEFEAEVITWDMSWETFECSGKPNYTRFPGFDGDLQSMREAGFRIGFWQSVLWISDYKAAGLSKSDLIRGVDGEPRLVNWINSPYNTGQFYYAIDPSSENAIRFLQDRTKYIVRELGADLLKLDFAYNIPSPDVGVPRDPALRGEMYGYTLIKIIADAAREANPDITLQYYGISPLMHPCYNLIALDDMGDAGNWEKEGHGQWSIWSALAGMQGRAIMASSGYDWDADNEVLMNTAIVGSPGLVLPGSYRGGPIPEDKIAPRVALSRWYRKTTGWEPLWLNSHAGSLDREPVPNCWGRLEFRGTEKMLTALALRQHQIEQLDNSRINGITFTGEWVLISQDNHSIYNTNELALIPFQQGELRFPSARKPARVIQVFMKDEKEYQGWSFENHVLSLKNDPGFREKAQCGFLVIWE